MKTRRSATPAFSFNSSADRLALPPAPCRPRARRASDQSARRRLTPVVSSIAADDGGMDLLVHPGDARQHGRPHRQERLGGLQGIRQEGDRVADVRAGRGASAARSCARAAGRAASGRRRGRSAADGRSPRPSRSSCGGGPCTPSAGPVVPEVYWSVKRSSSSMAAIASASAVGMLGLEPRALGLELRQVVHRQQVAESWQRAALLLDRRRLFRVSAQHPDGLRVVEDVGRVVGRAVRVDGGDDRADLREREVEQGPFHDRAGEDGERLALPDAAREEAVGQVLDALGGLGPADVVPVVAVLDEIGGALAIPRDSVLPEPCDRPFLSAMRGNLLPVRRCRNGESRAE